MSIGKAPSIELRVDDLQVGYWTPNGFFLAIQGVSLELQSGEIFGLVGESGSGKSCLSRSILGLPGGYPGIIGGQVHFNLGGEGVKPILPDAESFWKKEHASGFAGTQLGKAARWDNLVRRATMPLRGCGIELLFQNARGSLSPFHTIQQQVESRFTQTGGDPSEVKSRGEYWLDAVGLKEYGQSYAHTLSGGQAQRAAIAVAMAGQNQVLIADEPTTGLDASLRMEVVELMIRVVKDHGRTLLLISHDLAIVGYASNRIGVMYGGKLMEAFAVDGGRHQIDHPYSKELMATIDEKLREPDRGGIGEVGALRSETGCVFANRCSLLSLNEGSPSRCRDEAPRLKPRSGRHHVACWAVDEDGP
jgi:oligopeptide/dipeptide ABC transporter ATP-binding protein